MLTPRAFATCVALFACALLSLSPAARGQSGACCQPAGACVVQTHSACIGVCCGEYAGNGTTCAAGTCTFGACCTGVTTTCITRLQINCTGTWVGAASTCASNPCPQGACCAAAGTCSQMSSAACTGLFTLGGACATTICPQPPGACCDIQANCTSLTQAACAQLAHSQWQGGFTGCSPDPCLHVTGACCITGTTSGNYMCIGAASRTECSVLPHNSFPNVWGGPGSTCSAAACGQAACCAGGSCLVADPIQCAAILGLHQGLYTTCNPNPCAMGACCAGSTCSASTSAGCAGADTRFAGSGVACNAAGNNAAPCCKANFNQSTGAPAITVQDIFDFLGAWFAVDLRADFNGSGVVNAQDIFDFLGGWFMGC